MQRKIIRIFFKSLGFICLFVLLSAFALLLVIQSTRFQTWLGIKASNYLSEELKTKITVSKIHIDFFRKVELNGIYILDQHSDTLFNGDVAINIHSFNYRKKSLSLNTTTLKNVTSKFIQYKNDSTFNYQFLTDYFAGGAKDSAYSPPWTIGYGDLILDNLNFSYKNENFDQTISHTINYDNLSVKRMYGTLSDFNFLGDTICASVKDLRAIEHSGFELKHLSSKVKVSATQLLCEDLNLRTDRSLVQGQIQLNYKQWGDYQDFITKVTMNCFLNDSCYVAMNDLSSFSETLLGLNQTIRLQGKVKGTVSNLSLSDFKFSFGNYTRFSGNLALQGLPDINTSYIHINAKKFTSNYLDLIELPAYPFHENKTLPFPSEIKALGTIHYKGKFDGFINDFTTYGKFTTDLGNLDSHLSMRFGEKTGDISYEGEFKTEGLDIGPLIGTSTVKAISMSGSVKGSGIDINSIDSEFDMDIQNLNYLGYTYRGIKLEGKFSDKEFNGLLISKDPNADLDFNGSINFNQKIPEMEFISTINNLNLNNINLISDRDSGIFSTQIFIQTRGNSIDDLSGQINFDNTIYRTSSATYKLATFNIELDQEQAHKSIKLNSAYGKATLNGHYQLSHLKGVLGNYLYTYYPTFFSKPILNQNYSDSIHLSVTVKNFKVIHQLFIKNYMLSPGTKLDCYFNSQQNRLNVEASSGKFEFKNISLKDMSFKLNENGKNLNGELRSRTLNISDSVLIEQLRVSTRSEDKWLGYDIAWSDPDTAGNRGKVNGHMIFNPGSFDLSCDTLLVKGKNSTWSLDTSNTLSVLSNGNMIVEPFRIKNGDQQINIAGKYTTSPEDSLVFNANNVQLSEFNPLLKLLHLKLDGELNGNIVLSNTNNTLAFRGDLNMTTFKINNNALGEVQISTTYNTSENYIALEGYTSLGLGDLLLRPGKDVEFKGVYYLTKKEDAIDIDFKANPANLRLLNPLLEGFLTIKNGFVVGGGKVHGTPDQIKLDAKLKVVNSEVKFDYTNVTYFITGDIEIMPDQIRFSDLLLRDKSMRSAVQGTLNGNLFHSNFENIQLDYDINYKKMLVLNTTELQNSSYYGKVYSSGRVDIHGSLNNLNMLIIDTVTKNSKFFLPMDGPAELNDEDYIHFVVRDTLKPEVEKTLSGFNLEMFLYVTPDAEVSIIMDRKNGDMLNVQGQGNLNLQINTLGKFEMFGDYIITEGEYLFTLKTLINKKFAIDAGSSIAWSGDPLNAEIDVVTRYRQRTSVAPLLNDTTGQYNNRQPVDCKLVISGKLATPNIYFDIDVPNLDATAMARIDNVLSDEAELNRQVFSFLLFRSFVVPQIYTTQGGGVSAGGAAASTGSEMLSNRASEFINTYFGNLTGISDMQLGVNYRPGTSTSSEEFDVALSKQFMNNRISVDGNFGVNSNPNNSSSGLIGDVTVEYKLSDDGRYRLKVFNQTNDNTQVTIMGGLYTQGIGAFYREEFNSFKELMARYKDKSKANQQKRENKRAGTN